MTSQYPPPYPQSVPGYPQQPGYPGQQGYPPQAGFAPPYGAPQQQPYGDVYFQGNQGGAFPAATGFPMAGAQAGFMHQAMQPNEQQRFGSGGTGGYGGNEAGYGGDGENFGAFEDQAVRKGFIRKVYGILMTQLIITMAIMAVFVFHDDVNYYARRNSWMMYVGFGLSIPLLIVLACCTEVRRKAPMNYIFLFLFTLCEGFMLGVVSAFAQAKEVMMAVGICAAVTLALTLFAFQTKWDFTMMGGVLLAGVVILMLLGIFAIFVPGKTIRLVYAALGALIFSVYIIYDTQLMMGGKHKYSISPEEYVMAALNLYLDIVQLFMMILTLVSAGGRD